MFKPVGAEPFSEKLRISMFHNFKSQVSVCNRICDTKCIINVIETYLGCVLNASKKINVQTGPPGTV